YATAAIASGVITILWFWFFSVILLVGAQINSLAMGIGPWPFDISRILMDYKVPTEPGAPTALDAQRRKPRHHFLPFSGVARDSQDVHDVVTAGGKVEPQEKAGKDAQESARNANGQRASASPRDATTPGTAHRGSSAPNRGPAPSAAANGHHGAGAVKKQEQKAKKAREHDAAQEEHTPRSAHEMPSELVATGITTGGVKMETPRAVFGEPDGPPKQMIIFGAAIGLVTGLFQLRRRPRDE
ncbi:MAG TPA: hypothetical protein VHB98_11815, partial [Chloroflexota bacterium]|nr:hypothetical protein [Chloroflexota bacterium]